MEIEWPGKIFVWEKLAKVRFLKFVDIDHAHCSFCWAKFSDMEEDLHVGYITLDREDIICEECYNDFKDRFQWTLADEQEMEQLCALN